MKAMERKEEGKGNEGFLFLHLFRSVSLLYSRQCSKIRAYKEPSPPFSFPLPLFLGRLPQKNVAACMPTVLAFLTKEKKRKGEFLLPAEFEKLCVRGKKGKKKNFSISFHSAAQE